MSSDPNSPIKDDASGLPTKEMLERLKLKAEKEKLDEEIAIARRSMFHQREFYTAMAPLGLGIIGLLFSWWSGYFDNKLDRLEVEKKMLVLAVAELKKDSLDLFAGYSARNKSLDSTYDLKNDSLKSVYESRLETLTRDATESKQQNAQELDRLKQANTQQFEKAVAEMLKTIEFQKVNLGMLNETVYKERIFAADLARDKKEPKLARQKYLEALSIIPNAPYPAEQLAKIPPVTDVTVTHDGKSTCARGLKITIGGMTITPASGSVPLRNVKLGKNSYTVKGSSACSGGACVVNSKGEIVITEGMSIKLVFGSVRKSGIVSTCTVTLK